MHKYTNTKIHKYMYVYKYTNTHINKYKCTNILINTYTISQINKTQILMCAQIHTKIHIWASQKFTQAQIHIYIYKYIYTEMHKWTNCTTYHQLSFTFFLWQWDEDDADARLGQPVHWLGDCHPGGLSDHKRLLVIIYTYDIYNNIPYSL